MLIRTFYVGGDEGQRPFKPAPTKGQKMVSSRVNPGLPELFHAKPKTLNKRQDNKRRALEVAGDELVVVVEWSHGVLLSFSPRLAPVGRRHWAAPSLWAAPRTRSASTRPPARG